MDTVEESCKVLSISHQCSLLGISRSQHYYQPSFDQEKKDFKLLARIREVLLAHPYYGYRRVWREIDKRGHHPLSCLSVKLPFPFFSFYFFFKILLLFILSSKSKKIIDCTPYFDASDPNGKNYRLPLT